MAETKIKFKVSDATSSDFIDVSHHFLMVMYVCVYSYNHICFSRGAHIEKVHIRIEQEVPVPPLSPGHLDPFLKASKSASSSSALLEVPRHL